MHWFRPSYVFLAALSILFVPCASEAQRRFERGQLFEKPDWLVLGAEYRVQTIYIDPLDISGTEVTGAFWTEQRLNFDVGFKYPGIGGVYARLHVLDGVLFGDNGEIGTDPEPENGLAIAAKWPNNAGWEVGLRPGADPLDKDSYIPRLRGLDPIRVVNLFGEVLLPIGVIRVGRQPLAEGAAIAAHPGTRTNRWGVSRYPEVADRVLFGTKLDEIANVIRNGADHKPNPSLEDGVIFAQTFDWNAQDSIFQVADDTWQVNTLLSWRVKNANWGGADWRDFQLTFTFVHKNSAKFDTSIYALPIRFETRIDKAYLNLQLSMVFGETREVSEGLAVLSNKEAKIQDVEQFGLHFFYSHEVGPVELAFELDYARGDNDPRATGAITSFGFARDFNVGLLMFEHIFAFQTARSAAVGLENLRQLEAESFPLTEVATQGRFTNALAIFPQVKFRLLQNPQHDVHLRLGVLMAWSPDGVVDPVETALREDGAEIADDAVNFHGGRVGHYYGTEIDLQVEWTFKRFFTWTVEAAALMPGDALHDRNGDAVPSFMVENRFVFSF